MSKVDEIKVAVIRAVAELPDRNSPEGQPEMMLVSSRELLMILDEALAQQSQPLTDEQKNAMWVCAKRGLSGGLPEDFYIQGVNDAEHEHGIKGVTE